VGELETGLVREFFWALTSQAGADLHIQVPYGEDAHHMVEAIFKGFARALRAACAPEAGRRGVPSTKGVL
ncbi:MAG: imidazoleglycerol-phosphate dehydratase, partial [Nitrospinota bacterium]